MPIPSFKQIHLRSSKKEAILEQLESQDFSAGPFVLHIAHLMQHQYQAISSLEWVFKKLHLWNIPYPIYIIASISDYQGRLFVVDDIASLPEFWKQKPRSPNVKESTVLHKIELKQKNIQNFQKNDAEEALSDYGASHKKLFLHAKEGIFLEKLLLKLRNPRVQKK